MSQLAGRPGKAREQVPVQHHAAAYAGAQGHHNGASGALGRPHRRLCQGRRVGIIYQAHGKARVLQGPAHIIVYPADVAGVHHGARPVIHRAGAAQAHAGHLPAPAQGTDHGGHVLRHRRRATLRPGGAGLPGQNFPVLPDHGPLDTGAAQVDADVLLHVRASAFLFLIAYHARPGLSKPP